MTVCKIYISDKSIVSINTTSLHFNIYSPGQLCHSVHKVYYIYDNAQNFLYIYSYVVLTEYNLNHYKYVNGVIRS